MIHNLLNPEISVLEKIIRSIAVYVFLLVAFRIMGKRQVGQMTSFDLVFLLIISNVVQNAIIGADNSLMGGLIGACALFIINYLFDEISFRSKKLNRLMEFQPTVLVHDGKILQSNMAKTRITHEELLSTLRRHGLVEVDHVRFAVLESDGTISIITKPSAK